MARKTKTKVNPIIFWRTRQHLILSIIFALVSILILAFATYPQIQATLGLREKIKTLDRKNEEIEAKLERLKSITFDPNYEQAEMVDSALPSKKPLSELLANLDTLSVANNVTIVEYQLAPGQVATDSTQLNTGKGKTKDLDKLSISYTIQGSRDDVNNFLTAIEQISPFTTITKMTVSTSVRDGRQISMAHLTTDTYFFTQSIKTTVDAALPVINDYDQQVLSSLSSFSLPQVPKQVEVVGGGLEDPFRVAPLNFRIDNRPSQFAN